jgi:hypothetical protein
MDGGMHLQRGPGETGCMVPFAVVNRPFGTRLETTVEWGLSIQEMMEASGISPSMQRRTKCFLVDPISATEALIYPELWSKVRPKFGTEVVLRVFPGKGGGGGKGILGIVLSVAILAAAAFAGPLLIGAIPCLRAWRKSGVIRRRCRRRVERRHRHRGKAADLGADSAIEAAEPWGKGWRHVAGG